jgi:serine/threonine protein kinase
VCGEQDLALRNMLVGRDWRVRMADFGLARMMPKDTYAKTRGNIGAVRWLAPEVISKSVYSEKSDSYAFGIGTATHSLELSPRTCANT